MRMFLTLSLAVVTLGCAGFFSAAASGMEGISTISAESGVVTAASGKTVSVKCACPTGTQVIGGGGECYGFLVTDVWARLTKSAPLPGESSWHV
jgi:hypothetical protein